MYCKCISFEFGQIKLLKLTLKMLGNESNKVINC